MSNCNPPNLTATLGGDISCGDPKKTSVICSDIFVKFGEVEATVNLRLGYNLLTNSMKLQAIKESVSFKFKYDAPKYLAGSLVQLHDYYAETPMIVKPETIDRKYVISKNGEKTDVKFFKLTPWEFFGASSENAKSGWDFGNTSYNKNIDWIERIEDGGLGDIYAYNGDNPFLDGGLRQGYVREAQELIDRLKERERDFKEYMEAQAIHYVDYTNTMRGLYTLAAAGELPYDSITKKYRISEDGNGYTRGVKIVFNLYFKVIRGEFASNAESLLSQIKLEGKPASEALVSHDSKNCLRALVVLNKQDGSDNRKGVYFHGVAWGKSNPVETFLEPVRRAEPAHGYNAGIGKASGKTIGAPYKDAYKMQGGDRQSGEYLFGKKEREMFVVFEDGLGPWGLKCLNRAQMYRFLRMEKDWALAAAAAPDNYTMPNTIIWEKMWSYQNDVKPSKIATPSVKKKSSSGWEITPGLVVYFTAGQNVTNGDIQGSAAQMQILLPLEAFSILGDESLTIETLPGALWNIMSSAVFVVKIDVVQGIKDCFAIVNWYNIQIELKKQIEAMKRYAEEVRSKIHKCAQELTKAFEEKDINKYNEILDQMKAIAADFAQKTGYKIDLTTAIQGGNNLQAYIDETYKLQNEIADQSNITTITPAPDPITLSEPAPIHPPSVSINEVLDSTTSGTNPGQILVIPVPGGEPAGVNPLSQNPPSTSNPVDTVVLSPALDTPSVGSTYLLDNIGFPDGSTSDGFLNGIPGVDEGISGNEPWSK